MSADKSSPPSEPKFDTSEVRKASFWIAQICVIIATVLGVFLAASQGFKQAMAFEDIRSDKSNYYLRTSLRAEMAYNVDYVKKYVEKIRKDDGLTSRRGPIALQMFVWDSMKYSSSTLETPSELLNANIEFLRVVNATHSELASSNIGTKTGIDRLEAAVKNVEETAFPRFDENIKQLRGSLEGREVKL